ncbi:cold-shock protein [Priestia megaterium]|uniref:cold-shock protein n=1 Tax=Priestia megaterium TaxID=1404 RepID=UPI00366BA9D4
MSYYRKRNQEPLAQEQTEVWECIIENCKGWMRKDFSYDHDQKCPLCGNHMRAGERLIDKIPLNPHRK